MLNVLIVDDEPIVIKGIMYMFKKYALSVSVVGSAYSGKEAIELIERMHPDLVMIDIQMPGINGLEVIRWTRQRYPEIYFIVVTAYDFFEYAQEAISLGVSEFLLKPIQPDQLKNTVNRIQEDLKHKQLTIQTSLQMKEKINKMLPILEHQFISMIIFQSPSLEKIKVFEEIFEHPLSFGYMMLIDISPIQTVTSVQHIIANKMLHDAIKSYLKSVSPVLTASIETNRIYVYYPVVDVYTTDSYSIKNQSMYLAEKIMIVTERKFQVKLRIGIGNAYDYSQFNQSYLEAYQSLKMVEAEPIIHYSDITLNTTFLDPYPKQLEKIFVEQILAEKKEVWSTFNQLYDAIITIAHADLVRIKTYLIEIINILLRTFPNPPDKEFFLDHQFLEDILTADSILHLKTVFVHYLKQMMDKFNTMRDDRMNQLFNEAICLIHERYAEEITLNEVAQAVHMSYHYFSKQFKIFTGKNFTDYVQELRMKEAIRLLQFSNYSVKEISERVGYQDSNYFSKAFKKYTGYSPTDFRKIYYLKEGGTS